MQGSFRDLHRRQTSPQSNFLLLPKSPQTHHHRLEIPTAVLSTEPLTLDRCLSIAATLSAHPVFSLLSPTELESLVSKMLLYTTEAGEIVYETGFPGAHFYVLERGEVVVVSNGVEMQRVRPETAFGEPALLFGSPRVSSAKTTAPCALWTLQADEFRTAISLVKQKAEAEINSFLLSERVFASLSSKGRHSLFRYCAYEQFPAESRIIAQGTFGSVLYFVVSGEVAVSKDGREVRRLGRGEFFGEQAILYAGVRTADVRTLTPCTFLSLDKHHIQLVFDSSLNNFIYRHSLQIALESSPRFAEITPSQLECLISRLTVSTFSYDEIVVPATASFSEAMWIVLKGAVAVREDSGLSRRLGREFDLINEDFGLGQGGKVGWNVVADEDEVAAVEIPREDIERVLRGPLAFRPPEVGKSEAVALGIFTSLPLTRLIAFTKYAKKLQLLAGAEFPEYLARTHLCVLSAGQAWIGAEQVSAPFAFGSWTSAEVQVRTTCVSDCCFWLLHRTYFKPVFATLSPITVFYELRPQRVKVTLTNLRLVEFAKTSLGHLFIAAESPEKLHYLKRTSRKKAGQQHFAQQLLREREILQSLCHPAVPRFLQSSKDAKYVYFLLDYVPGQMLSEVLLKNGALGESRARVVAAMLVELVQTLHSHGILHRDLTPENFILDQSGCIRLIDIASGVPVEGNNSTLVGHPHYMAPEKVRRSSYCKPADLWSLGVFVFRLIFGRLPFGDVEEDPYIVYREILSGTPQYVPGVTVSDCCKSLLSQLLSQNPTDRGTIADVQAHAWFEGVRWVPCTQDYVYTEDHPELPRAVLPTISENFRAKKPRFHHSMVLSTQPNRAADELAVEVNDIF